MSKMKLLSDWASGVTVMTHSRFSEIEQTEICPICGERLGNTMSVEQRLPHMLPPTPLNQGGVGTAAQRDKITTARTVSPNSKTRVPVLYGGPHENKYSLLQRCERAMFSENWGQEEVYAFRESAGSRDDYMAVVHQYCFFLNNDGTLYEDV